MGARDTQVAARTGCDVQRVADVSDALRDFGARYLDRVYTAEEQTVLATGGAASLAARFAAKEAVLKVLGAGQADIGGVDLRSVEIGRGAHGRPTVRLSGYAADLAAAAGLHDIDVSLSHAGDLALAVAVALADTPTDGPATSAATGPATSPADTPADPTPAALPTATPAPTGGPRHA